jgi:hypothetical protein
MVLNADQSRGDAATFRAIKKATKRYTSAWNVLGCWSRTLAQYGVELLAECSGDMHDLGVLQSVASEDNHHPIFEELAGADLAVGPGVEKCAAGNDAVFTEFSGARECPPKVSRGSIPTE